MREKIYTCYNIYLVTDHDGYGHGTSTIHYWHYWWWLHWENLPIPKEISPCGAHPHNFVSCYSWYFKEVIFKFSQHFFFRALGKTIKTWFFPNQSFLFIFNSINNDLRDSFFTEKCRYLKSFPDFGLFLNIFYLKVFIS